MVRGRGSGAEVAEALRELQHGDSADEDDGDGE